MRLAIRLLSLVLVLVLSGSALAQVGVQTLVRQLNEGDDFRIRVRAALELGKVKQQKDVARVALESALTDVNVAVRSASVAALKVLGDRRSIAALRRLKDDPSSAVQRQAETAIAVLEKEDAPAASGVLVELGRLKDATGKGAPSAVVELRNATEASLGDIEGVSYVENAATSARLAAKTGQSRVKVSGWLKELKGQRDGNGLAYTASVEYVVYRMPGQAIAGKVRGTARVRCSEDELADPKKRLALQRSAIEAAVGSAMRRAPEAISAAAN